MSDYGLKVSKSGIDVRSASNTELAYTSKYSNFKILTILSTEITLTGSDVTGSDSISGVTTYSPLYFYYVNPDTQPGEYAIYNHPSDSDFVGTLVKYTPGTNTFDVTIAHTGSGTRVFTVKIVVFVDKLSGSSDAIPSIKDYGLKVSKEGFNVSSTEDHNLSMSSKFRNLTVFASGSITTTNTGEVEHNLGYVPIFKCFYQPTGDATHGDKWYPIPIGGVFNGSARNVNVWADDSKLYFYPDDGSNATKFRYLIFNERMA